MAEPAREPLLLVSSEEELPEKGRVWGTGRWLPPEDREALDWLTLSRLLGWGVTVSRPAGCGPAVGLAPGRRWIVIARNPDNLPEEFVAALTARLMAEPLLVVARAGTSGRGFTRLAGAAPQSERVAGRSLRWIGPGGERRWECRNSLQATPLELSEELSVWGTLEGAPIIAARPVGYGMVATLGFHPSHARDTDGAATALLRNLLIWGSTRPVAWLELEGSLVLRMDDLGGAQNVFNRAWSYPKLREPEWGAIGADLKRRGGRLSIGYSAGWVDDGDGARGALEVAGQAPPRIPGRVYPSPQVRYRDLSGHAPGTLHDYESEFQGIQALRCSALCDVELHGYTHMHPDSASWANAPDRYEAVSWFRELGSAAAAAIAGRPPQEHPLALGFAILRRHFQATPTTLICPGDQWTDAVLERALNLGMQLVSSYYLALRHEGRFCWAQHVCAPYLDEPDAAWFESGLPVVGYFHDRELALEGVGWMTKWLDRWQAAGARRFLDFRELASVVGRRLYLEERHGDLHLTVRSAGTPGLVRPLTVAIRSGRGRLPASLSVIVEDKTLSLDVQPLDEGLGSVVLPC